MEFAESLVSDTDIILKGASIAAGAETFEAGVSDSTMAISVVDDVLTRSVSWVEAFG